MSKMHRIISREQLQSGLSLAIDNAIELLSAAMELQEKHQSKALALAQIGQEEIGKSLTILAAFGIPEEPKAWEWFWKGWRDHKLKAHRAYLYELITPVRLEISSPDGEFHDGGPRRNPISREKEVGLYVDYDQGSKTFTSPKQAVTSFDCWARMSTLMYLAATADAVNRALTHKEPDFRFLEFGRVAFLLCTGEFYQQDMPAFFELVSAMSEEHRKMIEDLNVALEAPKEMFHAMVAEQNRIREKGT